MILNYTGHDHEYSVMHRVKYQIYGQAYPPLQQDISARHIVRLARDTSARPILPHYACYPQSLLSALYGQLRTGNYRRTSQLVLEQAVIPLIYCYTGMCFSSDMSGYRCSECKICRCLNIVCITIIFILNFILNFKSSLSSCRINAGENDFETFTAPLQSCKLACLEMFTAIIQR